MKKFGYGLAVALVFTLLAPNAHSATPKLPFIGKAEVNWLGGNGTARIITIKKNGTITIMGENLEGKVFYDYKGKFKNPLKIIDEDNNVYYYHFTKKKIALLDKHKKPLKDCLDFQGNEVLCSQEIEVYQ